MDTELAQCLIIRNPDWYEDEGFLRFLNGKRATTWHCKGEPVGEYSDVFVNYDHGDSSDYDTGDSSGIPDEIWEVVCDAAEAAGMTYGIIWIQNTE